MFFNLSLAEQVKYNDVISVLYTIRSLLKAFPLKNDYCSTHILIILHGFYAMLMV